MNAQVSRLGGIFPGRASESAARPGLAADGLAPIPGLFSLRSICGSDAAGKPLLALCVVCYFGAVGGPLALNAGR